MENAKIEAGRVTVGIVVISPHICCLLNSEEGKNNAFMCFDQTESTRNS